MPKRHPPEHQDDDRDDDENVEQEVWDEGIQCNEGSRAGGLEEELEALLTRGSEAQRDAKLIS
jgi:hypothetical protein